MYGEATRCFFAGLIPLIGNYAFMICMINVTCQMGAPPVVDIWVAMCCNVSLPSVHCRHRVLCTHFPPNSTTDCAVQVIGEIGPIFPYSASSLPDEPVFGKSNRRYKRLHILGANWKYIWVYIVHCIVCHCQQHVPDSQRDKNLSLTTFGSSPLPFVDHRVFHVRTSLLL